MKWRPLSKRIDPEAAAEYDALHEGIPPWLASGIGTWVNNVLEGGRYEYEDERKRLQVVEQLLRTPLEWAGGEKTARLGLVTEVAKSGPRALDILDVALVLCQGQAGDWNLRRSLESMLTIGGSAWTVGEDEGGRWCLHRRLDETVEDAAKEEMRQTGNAARHLQAAWHHVYGRDPDPSAAYREAVRAVEAAAKPAVTPNDRLATLGKMLKALRDKPSKWAVDLGTVEGLADTMDVLWTSQLDRHGTDDESAPLSVSPEQAEAAVHVAVTLVHWFRNGHVRLA